jgi:hypothetical protein
MNYKQQLSLIGGFGSLFLGSYLGFKYTVFQGKDLAVINWDYS